MNAQSPHVRAILHRLGHACGKSAYVHQLQRTVLDDIERRRRYIEHLPALGHACVGQQQRVMASVALPWQWVIHGLGRLLDTLERRPFVPDLATGRLARRLAQRARLLGKTIGRWRLARIVTVLIHLRFERIQTREQRQDEDVLLLVREARQIGSGRANMMNRFGIVYNLFIATTGAEQSLVLNVIDIS